MSEIASSTTATSPAPHGAVRVRIAPSPTGDPHVGTAYIGLFNAAFAKHHGGTFVLRIEDTDQKRSTEASELAIFRSLRWVGLAWQEGPDVGGPYGPYRQSERSTIYRAHCQQLLDSGAAYRCFCTPERLDQVRAAQRAAQQTTRYDGQCRDLERSEAERRAAAGHDHVVRLRMPRDGETTVDDLLRGQVVYDHRQMDDQVLLKSDGLPTYHLANVVDDHLMEISHVIRAEEWLNSTPKHLALYRAFGWTPPVFVHMPLLRNADRSKISKRKNPTSLEFYQRNGILPEAMLNFLGLMGYSMADEREQFSFEEFAHELELERVSLGGPVFDLQKLDWLNGLWLRSLAPDELAERAQAWHREDGRDKLIAPLVQERMTTWADWARQTGPFYSGSVSPGLYARHLLVGAASKKKNAARLGFSASRAYFEDVLAGLEALAQWQPDTIEIALRGAIERAGVLAGDGLMAIRVAAMGSPAAPPLFDTLTVLGRSVTLVRLRQAIAFLESPDRLRQAMAAAQAEIDATAKAIEAVDPASTPADTSSRA